MAEWFKAHAWKVCVLSKVPWVRIPLSPPNFCIINLLFNQNHKKNNLQAAEKLYKKILKTNPNKVEINKKK